MPKVLRTGNVALLPLAGLLAVLACADGSSAPAIATSDDVSFGDVDVGGSAAQNVTLTNTSTTPLDIVDVITSGEGITASGPALPISVAPGETVSLSVELAPTTTGDFSGSVSFLGASGTTSLARVRTVGRGVRANTLLVPTPVSLAFGDVTVGTRVTQDVTVTNTDSRDLRVDTLSTSGAGVTATGLPLPATFAPGESATFTVAFAPTAAGPVAASVALKNSDGRSLSAVEIAGSGVSPTQAVSLTATPSRLDFANVTVGTFSSQGVTLTNASSQSVTVSELAVTGAGYSASGLTLPATIPAGGSVQLSVKFTPTATGSSTGRVEVRSAATTTPLAVVDLSGSAVAQASITSVAVRNAAVETGKTVQLVADVVAVGTIDKSVTWSVDAASLGTVDAKTGVYTAPATAGAFKVWATSNADATKKAYGTVTVSAPATTTPPPPTTDPSAVDPKDYGAVGDGVADDTAAFQAAANTKKPLVITAPRSRYRFTKGVRIYNSVQGDGSMPKLWMDSPSGNSDDSILQVVGYAGTGMTISGLSLDGGWDGTASGEHSHGVYIGGSKNVTVEKMLIVNLRGDGVYVGGGDLTSAQSSNIVVRDNDIRNPRRCVVAVIHVNGLSITNNVFQKSNTYVATIDLEPNPNGVDNVWNVTIDSNTFTSPIENAVSLYHSSSWPTPPGGVGGNVKITNNSGDTNGGVNITSSSDWSNVTQSGNSWR